MVASDSASVTDGRSRKRLNRGQDPLKERHLVDVESEQLRRLVRHDDQADAGLEPGQHRLGDELRDEAEPKRPR
jgi:hypothetical protein